MISTVSEGNKIVAKFLASAFGGRPKVLGFKDENDAAEIDILICQDSPCHGVSSYATVGLYLRPITKGEREFPARIEVLGACDSSVERFGNVMSTIAFCIINDGWLCAPGEIFRDVIDVYNMSSTMRHVFFVSPFLWGDIRLLEISGISVAWLLAVPISDKERCFAEEMGSDALEDLFVDRQIDIFDINRPSVI